MLLMGRWRFVAGGLIGGLALLGASLALSTEATASYLRLAPTLSRWIEMPGMPIHWMDCWQGFWRLLLPGVGLRSVQALAGACSLATLGLLVAALRSSTGPDRLGDRFAALVVATLPVSPHLLHYDATLLILPIVLTATRPGRGSAHGDGWRSRWRRRPWSRRRSPRRTGFNPLVPAMVGWLAVFAARTRVSEPAPDRTSRVADGIRTRDPQIHNLAR